MEQCHANALQHHHVALMNHLEVDQIVNYLFAKRIILRNHLESIQEKGTILDRRSTLLSLLPGRNRRAFGEFCNGLNNIGQENLASKLLSKLDAIPIGYYVPENHGSATATACQFSSNSYNQQQSTYPAQPPRQISERRQQSTYSNGPGGPGPSLPINSFTNQTNGSEYYVQYDQYDQHQLVTNYQPQWNSTYNTQQNSHLPITDLSPQSVNNDLPAQPFPNNNNFPQQSMHNGSHSDGGHGQNQHQSMNNGSHGHGQGQQQHQPVYNGSHGQGQQQHQPMHNYQPHSNSRHGSQQDQPFPISPLSPQAIYNSTISINQHNYLQQSTQSGSQGHGQQQPDDAVVSVTVPPSQQACNGHHSSVEFTTTTSFSIPSDILEKYGMVRKPSRQVPPGTVLTPASQADLAVPAIPTHSQYRLKTDVAAITQETSTQTVIVDIPLPNTKDTSTQTVIVYTPTTKEMSTQTVIVYTPKNITFQNSNASAQRSGPAYETVLYQDTLPTMSIASWRTRRPHDVESHLDLGSWTGSKVSQQTKIEATIVIDKSTQTMTPWAESGGPHHLASGGSDPMSTSHELQHNPTVEERVIDCQGLLLTFGQDFYVGGVNECNTDQHGHRLKTITVWQLSSSGNWCQPILTLNPPPALMLLALGIWEKGKRIFELLHNSETSSTHISVMNFERQEIYQIAVPIKNSNHFRLRITVSDFGTLFLTNLAFTNHKARLYIYKAQLGSGGYSELKKVLKFEPKIDMDNLTLQAKPVSDKKDTIFICGSSSSGISTGSTVCALVIRCKDWTAEIIHTVYFPHVAGLGVSSMVCVRDVNDLYIFGLLVKGPDDHYLERTLQIYALPHKAQRFYKNTKFREAKLLHEKNVNPTTHKIGVLGGSLFLCCKTEDDKILLDKFIVKDF